ncbi:hypothetical protein HRE53_26675 (plasmid) [Acaryochloris sp. 'Moss Beach']|uniref:hypothetical protein n=1 Tax=Acaryochloris TaxID=155977 RepID=UPI001BB06550|nr:MULTISPECIES: hypothetical protein [Acaryochloris]QUY45869.1 hypothetical protein I1H34_29480 [Acaryochloris marina S15]UJB72487.1 hypothetical protein HRE53_26675 [Acaryochloris sp. 'Moss Beach']
MNCIHALSDYLCRRFPWCKGSQLRYEPDKKTVYIHCQHLSEPEILFHEADAIARLDIGVERLIIVMPDVMDMVIECRPNQYKESL